MKHIALALAMLSLTACATAAKPPPTVRASTAELMPTDQTRLLVNKSKNEVVDLVKKLMAERGLRVKAVAPTHDNTAEYYVFTGPRKATVGSWISVRVEAKGKSTQLKFLGKPNIGGQELCSDADTELADAEYWCKDTGVNRNSPYSSQLSGREEAELIRGVIAEIKAKTM